MSSAAARAASASVWILTASLAAQQGSRSDLLPIPQPDVSAAEAGVQTQVAESQATLDRMLADITVAGDTLADTFGDLGMIYVVYEFQEAALLCFENAQRLVPTDFRWPYLRGYLLKIQGKLEPARELLAQSLELTPSRVPTLIRLARTELELGNVESAATLYERALELDSDSAAVLEGLGKVASRAGEHARAVDLLSRALALQPEASSLHYLLGQAHRRLGDIERAREHLSSSGDALVKIADPLLDPLATLGKSSQFYIVQGGQALEGGRFDAAADAYRRALEFDPTKLQAIKGLGYSLQQLGDTEGAIAQLRAALAAPESAFSVAARAEIHRLLGGLLTVEGRDREAVEQLSTAVELEPEGFAAVLNLADALARLRRFEEAAAQYDRFLAAFPTHSDARVKRATVRLRLEDRDGAVADFEAAVEAAPDNPQLRLRYSDALAALGDVDGARIQAEQASKLGSEDKQRVGLLIETARRQVAQGRFESGLDTYREALEVEPGHVEARYGLATVLGHLGRLEQAEVEFATILETDPRHTEARKGLITARLLREDYTGARDAIREALTIRPRDGHLAHALARLLAAAPESETRNAALAVELGERLRDMEGSPAAAQTLAMAKAEAGEYTVAVELLRGALAKLEDTLASRGAGLAREQLASYEERRAWRLRSPDEIILALRGEQ